MQNLWEPFGLRSTPYFHQPLDPSPEGQYPITLYVQRGVEDRLLNRIASSHNSISIVESLPGGGKTTFINYVKFVSASNGYAVSPSHVRVTSAFGYRDFALETLVNVLRPLLHPSNASRKAQASSDPAVREALDRVNQASRGGGTWSLGLTGSVEPIEGAISLRRGARTQEAPPIENARLYSMASAVATAVTARLGYQGVVIHVNNLELAALGETTWPGVLFNDIRDFLQIPGLHFVIGASRGFVAEHLARHPRVASILQSPIDLAPLTTRQVADLVEKRYEKLATSPGTFVIPPVKPTAIERLHQTFNGDLRAMFGALQDAVERRIRVDPSSMTFEEVVGILRGDYAENTVRDLPRAAASAVEKLRQSPRPFTQADLSKAIKKSQGRVSQLLAELQGLGVVVQVESKKPYHYDFSGKAKIALGLPI